ncbi:MAG: hypothetical protein ACFE8A_02695 [Candidatus Hodarchaeota archaeon]
MSYIEKKYLNKINEIFKEELPQWEGYLLELLNKRSIAVVDNIAKVCADFNKNINLILKQYYPEIKDMNEKLNIKSVLKFYFDLIDYLTDFIRNVENFQKISQEYYETIIKFIEHKNYLIEGKYRDICKLELTSFYDKQTRENLERIISEKFDKKSREFFTFGSLEEEIKKIAKVTGADKVSINIASSSDEINLLKSAKSVISYSVESADLQKLKKIGEELKKYLESKGYEVKILDTYVLTNAHLLPDN